MWSKNMWKRIPHLIQQQETPRKGYKINKVEHFIITQADITKAKWTNTKNDQPHSQGRIPGFSRPAAKPVKRPWERGWKNDLKSHAKSLNSP